jgi:uncharacterized protein YceK
MVSVLLVVVFLSISGCASILSKSQYSVTITSNPQGATITIVDKEGKQIFQGTTPTIVILKSGAGFFKGATYTVSFKKPGYEPQTVVIKPDIDGWYIGNILFGGLIGLLIVDPATGAMWKLPPEVSATLTKETSSLIIDGKELKIAFIEDIPVHLRAKMVRIR